MNIKQRRLPSAYQECEWIGASGGQFFQSNVVPTENVGFKMKYYHLSNQDTNAMLASYSGDASNMWGLRQRLGIWQIFRGGVSTPIVCGTFPITMEVEFNWHNSGICKITQNGITSQVTLGTYVANDVPLYIFNQSTASWSSCKNGRAYSLEFCNGTTTIANLIPCYRISDSVIGMYDTIGGTFYTNQGTGTFTKGADVVTLESMAIPEGNVIEMVDSHGNVLFKKHKVHFQQLINSTGSSITDGGVTFTKNSNGSWTLVGTTTATNVFRNINYQGNNACNFISGHQYIVHPTPPNIDIMTDFVLRMYNTNGNPSSINGWESYPYDNPFTIINAGNPTWMRFQVGNSAGVAINQTVYPMLFDITAMFADCPELTPTTYQQFRDMFPAEYYPYTAQPYDVWI